MYLIYTKFFFTRNSFLLFLLFLTVVLSSCDHPYADDVDGGMDDLFSAKQVPLVTYSEGTPIPGQYIIMFKENAVGDAEMNRIAEASVNRDDLKTSLEMKRKTDAKFKSAIVETLATHKVASNRVVKTFSIRNVQGAVVNLNEDMLNKVLSDPKVSYVEQDRLFALNFVDPSVRSPMIPSSENFSSSQATSYGVDRVGGSVKQNRGNVAWAWVIDTGIDLDHPDLRVNRGYSKNFVPAESKLNYSGDDNYGHGTHVAGIIGAIDNRKGVRGVAPGAHLVSVKVIDDSGEGTVSDLLDGLAWVHAYSVKGDVVNMSLGGGISESIDLMVRKIAQKGVSVVIAAGNAFQDASTVSPARVNEPNVYTISAIDENDKFCSFSNYGKGIDFAAPGANIISTFLHGQYAYASGTSMAAPHAAGVLLITGSPLNGGGVLGDPDGATDQVIMH